MSGNCVSGEGTDTAGSISYSGNRRIRTVMYTILKYEWIAWFLRASEELCVDLEPLTVTLTVGVSENRSRSRLRSGSRVIISTSN